MSACGSCGAEILWAKTLEGARMPLDPLPVGEFASVGLVMRNPKTGKCKVLTQDDMGYVDKWRRQGGTVHRSHWSTCPSPERHRVHPEQEALAI